MKKMLLGLAVLVTAFAVVPAALADGFSFSSGGNNNFAYGNLNVGQNGHITGGTINFDGGTYSLFTNGGTPNVGQNQNLNGNLFFTCGGQEYEISQNDLWCVHQGNGWQGNFNCDPGSPSPTPEPASLLLLGTGVLALAGLAKLKLG